MQLERVPEVVLGVLEGFLGADVHTAMWATNHSLNLWCWRNLKNLRAVLAARLRTIEHDSMLRRRAVTMLARASVHAPISCQHAIVTADAAALQTAVCNGWAHVVSALPWAGRVGDAAWQAAWVTCVSMCICTSDLAMLEALLTARSGSDSDCVRNREGELLATALLYSGSVQSMASNRVFSLLFDAWYGAGVLDGVWVLTHATGLAKWGVRCRDAALLDLALDVPTCDLVKVLDEVFESKGLQGLCAVQETWAVRNAGNPQATFAQAAWGTGNRWAQLFAVNVANPAEDLAVDDDGAACLPWLGHLRACLATYEPRPPWLTFALVLKWLGSAIESGVWSVVDGLLSTAAVVDCLLQRAAASPRDRAQVSNVVFQRGWPRPFLSVLRCPPLASCILGSCKVWLQLLGRPQWVQSAIELFMDQFRERFPSLGPAELKAWAGGPDAHVTPLFRRCFASTFPTGAALLAATVGAMRGKAPALQRRTFRELLGLDAQAHQSLQQFMVDEASVLKWEDAMALVDACPEACSPRLLLHLMQRDHRTFDNHDFINSPDTVDAPRACVLFVFLADHPMVRQGLADPALTEVAAAALAVAARWWPAAALARLAQACGVAHRPVREGLEACAIFGRWRALHGFPGPVTGTVGWAHVEGALRAQCMCSLRMWERLSALGDDRRAHTDAPISLASYITIATDELRTLVVGKPGAGSSSGDSSTSLSSTVSRAV